MSYTPINWQNGKNGGTATSAGNFNHMEKGILDAHEVLTVHEETLADHESKINDFANQQIPEEYLKKSVDTYIAENAAGLATKEEAETLDAKIEEVDGRLSSEIANSVKAKSIEKIEGDFINIDFPNTDKTINTSDGTLADYNGLDVTDFIDLAEIKGIFRYGVGDVQFFMYAWAYYDENEQFLQHNANTTDYEYTTYKGLVGCFYPIENAPTNAKYIRLTTDRSRNMIYVTIHNVNSYSIDGELKEYVKKRVGVGVGVSFGDSLTMGIGTMNIDNADPISKMAYILDTTCFNGGIGGTTLSDGTNASFAQIADAISSGDWTDIQAEIDSLVEQYPSTGAYGFPKVKTRYAEIVALDWNDVDFITVAYGTNDFTANREIDNADNQKDRTTICGALRYGIDKILTAYPHIKIYVFTPAFRYWNTVDNNSNVVMYNNHYLAEVAESIKNVCDSLAIPCKDMMKESAINQYNVIHYFAENDGTHRNEMGNDLLAEQQAKFILSH